MSQSQLARALYDNAAECAEELAFRKGEVLSVVDRRPGGASGWWLCSLHGRQGVAPANRLQLLPPPAPAPCPGDPGTDRGEPVEWPDPPDPPQGEGAGRPQNIYQIPSGPRPSSSPLYERMDKIYKAPPTAPGSPGSTALRRGRESASRVSLPPHPVNR